VKPVAVMGGVSAAAWLAAALVVDRRTGIEILFGMMVRWWQLPVPGYWLNGFTGSVRKY